MSTNPQQNLVTFQKLNQLPKSDYTSGMECPGHLWMKYHDKENIPPHSPGVLKRFEQGHVVGELAKKLYPEGIDIDAENIALNLQKTKELLPRRKAGIYHFNYMSTEKLGLRLENAFSCS